MVPFNPDDLVHLLAESEENLTARAYIRKISDHLGVPMVEGRKILKNLVNTRKVAYQALYGSTYVMESFLKPVRLTDRFYIVPPGMENPAGSHALNIHIHQGISFGSGHHPTTRLCLEALDHLFFHEKTLEKLSCKIAGDVGTGSGVLAIAACLAGMASCQAWEIDPNAVSEAEQNVSASRLGDQITVTGDYMPPLDQPLALICANLRYPTLKQLIPLFGRNLLPGGALVMSGLRSWEQEDLVASFQARGFTLAWKRQTSSGPD